VFVASATPKNLLRPARHERRFGVPRDGRALGIQDCTVQRAGAHRGAPGRQAAWLRCLHGVDALAGRGGRMYARDAGLVIAACGRNSGE
jgi:hypothetical protein